MKLELRSARDRIGYFLHKSTLVIAIVHIFMSGYPIVDVLAERVNTSRVEVENGIPKLMVNDQVINNMFGIYVYCTGIDPNTPQFLKDMKTAIDRTRDLDIPILSFDILWADYDRSDTVPKDAEEAANRFNTVTLDAVLDYAAKMKVYVVVQLLVHAHWGLPRWWKSYKDNYRGYQLIDRMSDPLGDYNRFQNPVASYQHETHRQLLRALIGKLVKRYRNHPAVVGWGINLGPTGENGYTPNYIDLMFNRRLPRIDLRVAMGDYSEVATQRFCQWLKRKYIDLSSLNMAWDTDLRSFEEISPPFPIRLHSAKTYQKNGDERPSMRDWQVFRYEALIDEWKFLSNLVRTLDPGKILIGKTNWIPMGPFTGTNNMVATAVAVNEQHLIDADKVDGGIMMEDYLPIPISSSKIDYFHFAKFSSKHRVVRIINMENWIKTGPTLSPGAKIPLDRALSVKKTIQEGGAYMWLTAALDSDCEKPSWSWDEIENLVQHSGANELKQVTAKAAPVRFYYDVHNLMSHYYQEQGNLQTSKMSYNIARAFFDLDGKVEYGFISASDVVEGFLDPKAVQLLIMVNQRILLPDVVKGLSKYLSDGGTVLLVGSNGVFDDLSKKNDQAIKKLAPQLTEAQILKLYDWGLDGNIEMPLLMVSGNSFNFTCVPVFSNPVDNYQLLRKVLSERLALPKEGQMTLIGTHAHKFGDQSQEKDFVRDFDRNHDGVVSKSEFPGPPSIFQQMDRNGDGIVTKEEAKPH